MFLFNRPKLGVAETRQYEQLQADVAKYQADLDYIAMMTDVEIPTEDTENGGIDNE